MTRVLQILPFPSVQPRDGGQIRARQTGKALEEAGFTLTRCPIYHAAWHPNSVFQPPVIDLDKAVVTPRYRDIWQLSDLTNGEVLANDEQCFAAFKEFVEGARPDVLVLEHPWMWPAVKKLPSTERPPVVYNSYNLEAELKCRMLKEAGIAESVADVAAAEIESLERELVDAASAVSATTEADATVYRNWTRAPVVVASNGAERRARAHLRGVLPTAIRNRWRYLLFVASAHPPNCAGFAELVIGGLVGVRPNERIVVAGSVCDGIWEHLRNESALGSDRLVLRGQVSSHELDSLIENATGMILPITYGGGSNLKTPEALLTGHPIIATARAFRGFEAFADMPGVIIAETVDAFSAAMRRVLSGEVPAPRHDKRLDSLVWDRTLQPIINLVRRLAPAHGSVDAVQTGLDDNHEADEFAKALPAAEAKIDSTDIELMGSPAIVYGCLDDDYFTKLPSYAAQNALFVAEAMKLPRDGVIMDVGANLGITTIIGSRCVPHGRVVAIEPSPRAYECLIRTVAANDLANCTVINKCLGETGGLVAFVETPFIAASHVGLYTAAGSDGNEADPFLADSHAGADRGPPVRIMTPITTIDAVVAELSLQRLDLIKIDVEGFELDVLKGASQAIRRLRPRFVMEFNSFLLVVNRNVSPRRLLDFVLARFGSFSTERNGVTTTISTASQAQDFLYSNMTTQHCVDDIAFGG